MHIHTLDAFKYDLQSVGEFVLIEDGNGFVVQTRQEPVNNRRDLPVSVNTAAAMNVAGDRVGVYLYRTPTLYVNGVPTDTTTDFVLPNGGTIYFVGDRDYRIKWPNGAVVNVRKNNWHLNVGVSLPFGMRGHVAGLIGNYDADRNNDLFTRGGGIPWSGQPDPLFVHGEYASSWRIAQSESLFDYLPGNDTATFTDLRYPDRYVSIASLTKAEYDAARATCEAAGITHPDLLENCILDFALTGDFEFVQSASESTAPNGVILLGTAFMSDGKIHLTKGRNIENGAAWFDDPIDLRQDFDHEYRVYLGRNDGGGEGIVFVLVPGVPTELGLGRGGLGFTRLCRRCIGVELDTSPDLHDMHISGDHIGVILNGSRHHDGPAPWALLPELEDGREHTYRLAWSASEQRLRAYVDGRLLIDYAVDLVQDVFQGTSVVYYGFTGSTGLSQNLQYFYPAPTGSP